jgi:uncharacterized protein (DUF1778 family)
MASRQTNAKTLTFPARRKRAGQDRDFNLRFSTTEEYERVKKAAAARNLSINRFLVETILSALEAAERQKAS